VSAAVVGLGLELDWLDPGNAGICAVNLLARLSLSSEDRDTTQTDTGPARADHPA
jgi:hypothetical protein